MLRPGWNMVLPTRNKDDSQYITKLSTSMKTEYCIFLSDWACWSMQTERDLLYVWMRHILKSKRRKILQEST